MKVVVLTNSDEEPTADLSIWAPEHQFEYVLVLKETVVEQLMELRKQKFDMYINLCDAGSHTNFAGIEVIKTLEKFNVPFTGVNSACFDPSKLEMKMQAKKNGVLTPAWVYAENDDTIEMAHEQLKYPLIVKQHNGSSSIGMTKDSKIMNKEHLYREARRFIAEYKSVLIEEFIEGREFTVLVCEDPNNSSPIVFNPIECVFTQGEEFKHYHLKWVEFHKILSVALERDSELASRLMEAASNSFKALNFVGYGRCDFRMDTEGNLYFLEINDNCGVFYPPHIFGCADHIINNDPMGHSGFIKVLFECAFNKVKNDVPLMDKEAD